MPRTRGIQSEILISLVAVVVLACALLAAFFVKTHAVEGERTRALLGRALLEETRSPNFDLMSVAPGVRWWVVSGDAVLFEKGGPSEPLDAEGWALARAAREEAAPVIRSGLPWQPIRFAAPSAALGGVAVATLAPVVSAVHLAVGLVVTIGVFVGLGATLMRRRVVAPLGHLAWAAREVAEGGPGVKVDVEGVSETVAVATAFNEMNEALAARTSELEKAIQDLRGSNQQLRAARAGLDRAERLAAVGSLAAGVAHEVGNPMGALLAFLDLARRDGSLSAEALGYLDRASTQGSRVREILRQLLDFSRPPRAESRLVDLAAVAEQTAGLVRAQRRYESIDIEIERHADLVPALADESLISQILLNLLLNAADALAGREAPRIRVRIQPAPLRLREGETLADARGRREFDAIACEVADSGPGVSEEDRERIFDPFYTTKPPGEGTGLGLANAQRLAEELGGVLDYHDDAELGGAAFTLRLPTARSPHPEVRRGTARS